MDEQVDVFETLAPPPPPPAESRVFVEETKPRPRRASMIAFFSFLTYTILTFQWKLEQLLY